MQIQAGTVSISNSAHVIGDVNCDWTLAVANKSWFSLRGSEAVPLTILSLTNPASSGSGFWECTLSASLALGALSGQLYTIHKDFTLNYNLPVLEPGDVQTAQILTRCFEELDSTAAPANGFEYIQLPFPDPDNAGSSSMLLTAEGPTGGHMKFDNAAAKATNFAIYRIRVPDNFDTLIDPSAAFAFRLAGADTGKHAYYISMADVAPGASCDLPVFTNEIAMLFLGDSGGASGDMEQIGYITLADWASDLTPGHMLVIKVARDGADSTNDTSTVNSTDVNLTFKHGTTRVKSR